MRMKDDHMRNRQLKPAYNVQISTENQIIVHYTLHQKTNDIHTLKPHLDSYEYLYGNLPEVLTADAGYGSEENYEYLESKGIETYRSEEHTSELQSRGHLVCRLLLEKNK